MEEKRQQTDLAETLLDDGSHRVQSMQLCSRMAGKGIIGLLLMIQICASFKYFMGQISSTTPLVSTEGEFCNIRNVSFRMSLDGTVLRGRLMQPDGSSSTNKVPILLSGPSWGADINLGGSRYEDGSICDAGYAVMAFDWKSYGVSDGEPRCVANWWEQLDSYRDALDFVESQEFVDKDRIVICGDSYAAALSLTLAAIDPRVKALMIGTPGLINNISDTADPDAFAEYKQTLLERTYLQAQSYTLGPMPIVTSDPNDTTLTWMGMNSQVPYAASQGDVDKLAARIRDYYLFQGSLDPWWRNETTSILLETPQNGTADIPVHFVYQRVWISCSPKDEFTVYDDCEKLFRVLPSKDKELTYLMGAHVGSDDTDRPNFGDRPPAFYDDLEKTLKFLKRWFP